MTFIQEKQKEAQDIFIANMIAFEEMTPEHKTEKRTTFILKQLDTLIATTIQDTTKKVSEIAWEYCVKAMREESAGRDEMKEFILTRLSEDK